MSLSLAFVQVSCGGGGGGGGGGGDADPVGTPAPVVNNTRPVSMSDREIAQLIYAGNPRTPADFLADAPPSSYANVATEHLKNSDITAVSDAVAEYELCTDDWNQALSWSELQQQRASQYADLVATNDDQRFFEFGRVRPGEPQFYLRGRVFKCTYLDRTQNNLRTTTGPAGRLKASPLDAAALKHLSEYLWQFTTFNNFGHAVLVSRPASNTGALAHSLVIASLTRAGVSASCDRISVIDWRHDADANTGELTRSIATLWTFGAREVNGMVEMCAG